MSATADTSSRIVVGVDGAPQSIEALRWAARLAACTGSTIEAVTSWSFPVSSGWGGVPETWDPHAMAAEVSRAAVEEAFGAQAPPGLTTRVEQGSPSRVLLDVSEGALMLVVGSRGHGGFAGLLLGSVSSVCAEHAHCPVLVVHGTAPESPF